MVDNNYIINLVLSKLDFAPLITKIENLNNKIFIKCHNYLTSIFNNNDINKIINYKQIWVISITSSGNKTIIPPPQYYNDIIDNIDVYKTLFLKINYADIIIDLETKTYKIINIKFNIKKPIQDKYNYFTDLIKNINNPDYKFILHYDIDSFSKTYSDIKNNIYDLARLKIIINPIYYHLNEGTNMDINIDVDTKPTVSNQIKRTETYGILI